MINAQGEYEAAERLVQAGEMMRDTPIALHLRYLQTMSEVGAENVSFALLPFPIEFLEAFRPLKEKGDEGRP